MGAGATATTMQHGQPRPLNIGNIARARMTSKRLQRHLRSLAEAMLIGEMTGDNNGCARGLRCHVDDSAGVATRMMG